MTEPNGAFEGLVDELLRTHDEAVFFRHKELRAEKQAVEDTARQSLLDAYAEVVAERDAAHAERDFWVESATSNAVQLAAAKAEIERLNAEADKRNAQIFDLHAEVERQLDEERRKSEPPIVVRTPRRVGPLITDKPMHEFPPTMGNRRD